jgi:NAD(P)H-hydrate epimerase
MLNREMSRRVDEIAVSNYGISSLVLMENAGRSCAECLLNWTSEERHANQAVLILCGPGNNGGDGFVIARHLAVEGCRVKVVLFRKIEQYAGDSRINLDVLLQLDVEIDVFDSAWTDEQIERIFASVGPQATTWVVDALLGTGATGSLRPPMAKAVTVANLLPVFKLAVDLPTGLDCDSGEAADPTFRADVTCTMVDEKIGFRSANAHLSTGKVVIVGIGVPVDLESLQRNDH